MKDTSRLLFHSTDTHSKHNYFLDCSLVSNTDSNRTLSFNGSKLILPNQIDSNASFALEKSLIFYSDVTAFFVPAKSNCSFQPTAEIFTIKNKSNEFCIIGIDINGEEEYICLSKEPHSIIWHRVDDLCFPTADLCLTHSKKTLA